jgi:predicted site-specific integrase-resolvase
VILSQQQTARILGVHVNTLRGWRLRGQGPPVTMRAGVARYALADVLEWQRTVEGREQHAGGGSVLQVDQDDSGRGREG